MSHCRQADHASVRLIVVLNTCDSWLVGEPRLQNDVAIHVETPVNYQWE